VIRVLHVLTRLALGGSSENTVATIVGLAPAGYAAGLAVGLAESEAAVVADARRRGCRLVDVPALGREVRPLADLAALGQLWALIRRERPQIVHTHTSKAGFLGRLAARLARVPAVIHQPHGHVFYGYWGAPRTALYVALERWAARWTDRIVTLTERGTEEHLARGNPLASNRGADLRQYGRRVLTIPRQFLEQQHQHVALARWAEAPPDLSKVSVERVAHFRHQSQERQQFAQPPGRNTGVVNGPDLAVRTTSNLARKRVESFPKQGDRMT